MKSDLILWVESYLKNFALGPAIEKATIQGPLYTSKDVWGNEVRFNRQVEGDKWEVKSYKLNNYYAKVEFGEDEVRFLTDYYDRTALIDMIEQDIYKQNLKMFGGEEFLNLPLAEKNKYTCQQLCDWRWLENEDGSILRESETEHGTIYSATLAKYALVLDENGEPLK